MTWRDFGWWLLRRRRRFRVQEASMAPVLAPGDEILVDVGVFRQNGAHVGDLVVAHHPREPVMQVKRVTALTADGRYFLEGDNAEVSNDSRQYGPVTAASIIGVVVCRFG